MDGAPEAGCAVVPFPVCPSRLCCGVRIGGLPGGETGSQEPREHPMGTVLCVSHLLWSSDRHDLTPHLWICPPFSPGSPHPPHPTLRGTRQAGSTWKGRVGGPGAFVGKCRICPDPSPKPHNKGPLPLGDAGWPLGAGLAVQWQLRPQDRLAPLPQPVRACVSSSAVRLCGF